MNTTRTTLFAALRRTNLHSTLLAILVAGAALTVVTFVTLRSQQHANLNLVARTIAYSVEAATLFGDAATATEILAQIAEREHLVNATVTTRDGRTLAHYTRKPPGTLTSTSARSSTGWRSRGRPAPTSPTTTRSSARSPCAATAACSSASS